MFESVGFSEILFIAAIALIFLGPEQFPKYAKLAARFIRDIKAYANEVQSEIGKELKPLTKELGDLRKVDPKKYLDKLIAEDEADTRPPNPEPHPSEMGFGAPAETSHEAGEDPATANGTTNGGVEASPAAAPTHAVSYGSAGPYPTETDVPPTPAAVPVHQPERLDG